MRCTVIADEKWVQWMAISNVKCHGIVHARAIHIDTEMEFFRKMQSITSC